MTSSKITEIAFTAPASEATQVWRSHTATFMAHWGRSGAVLSAHGEIDAANAGRFADCAKHSAGSGEWLVLDLSELTFIGTEGFSALKSISAQCARTRTDLMVVPSPAVRTLLRICDPHAQLPLAASLSSALAEVQRSGRPLRLVP
ncbi:STAS domain-containing protein [[Mycobacterium] kokjensenii]|uniref:STAS domain-containing protein n=1 Tax=[Mycobacterium] kokjensenii TaxID=3064287 RepID=A0ABN9NC00_9MYCO|nr:STAS domain-containing protein [Mycolicibacter sp. MU0083]CAJ1501982.1 STAS domain-containing protein [Mycolicibacter sp. MU0083]